MSKTTLWYLSDSSKTFESLKEQFVEHNFSLDEEAYPDFKQELVLNSEKIAISNFEVEFCLYNYSILSATGERISNILILFKKDDKVGFIVEKNSYPGALKLLRALCGYEDKDKNVIISGDYENSFINGKVFFWIISKIYKDDSEISYVIDGTEKKISLDSLDGLKGNAKVTLNNVSTQGSDVINMLTTLAFLIESEKLTEVALVATYDVHKNIKFIIHLHSRIISIDVDTNNYIGNYKDLEICKTDGTIDDFKLRAMLLIAGHLGFIPTLQSLYILDASDVEVKKSLVIDITEDISKRIEELQKENGIEEGQNI